MCIYTCSGIILACEKGGVLPFVRTWMDRDSIMPTEINHTEKDKCCMISFECGGRYKTDKIIQIQRTDWWLSEGKERDCRGE